MMREKREHGFCGRIKKEQKNASWKWRKDAWGCNGNEKAECMMHERHEEREYVRMNDKRNGDVLCVLM